MASLPQPFGIAWGTRSCPEPRAESRSVVGAATRRQTALKWAMGVSAGFHLVAIIAFGSHWAASRKSEGGAAAARQPLFIEIVAKVETQEGPSRRLRDAVARRLPVSATPRLTRIADSVSRPAPGTTPAGSSGTGPLVTATGGPTQSTVRASESSSLHPGVTDRDSPPEQRGSSPKSAFVDVTPVTYLHAPAPHYPAPAREDGEEGLVVLRVLVSKDGRPVDVCVRTSSGFQLLDAAAAAGVNRWTFHPARQGQQFIDALIDIPIRFRLERS